MCKSNVNKTHIGSLHELEYLQEHILTPPPSTFNIIIIFVSLSSKSLFSELPCFTMYVMCILQEFVCTYQISYAFVSRVAKNYPAQIDYSTIYSPKYLTRLCQRRGKVTEWRTIFSVRYFSEVNISSKFSSNSESNAQVYQKISKKCFLVTDSSQLITDMNKTPPHAHRIRAYCRST